MKTNQTRPLRNVRNVVTTVRAMIERQHSPLSERESRLLHLALNEAEALAWETGVPHLVFPTLALEKIRSVTDSPPRSEPSFALAA